MQESYKTYVVFLVAVLNLAVTEWEIIPDAYLVNLARQEISFHYFNK
jgi:hypothetical protein